MIPRSPPATPTIRAGTFLVFSRCAGIRAGTFCRNLRKKTRVVCTPQTRARLAGRLPRARVAWGVVHVVPKCRDPVTGRSFNSHCETHALWAQGPRSFSTEGGGVPRVTGSHVKLPKSRQLNKRVCLKIPCAIGGVLLGFRRMFAFKDIKFTGVFKVDRAPIDIFLMCKVRVTRGPIL